MTTLGVSLLVIGAVCIIVEAHVSTLGVLGAPGVLAVAVGAVLTVSGFGGGFVLGLLTAVLLAIAGMGVLVISLDKGRAVRRRRVRTGREGLIGHLGVVRSWAEPTGSVLVDGALWSARRACSDEEGAELHEGDSVVVERLSGLTLAVRRAEEWELVL
jgi:membrane-bound serine protease (ClpP class)